MTDFSSLIPQRDVKTDETAINSMPITSRLTMVKSDFTIETYLFGSTWISRRAISSLLSYQN